MSTPFAGPSSAAVLSRVRRTLLSGALYVLPLVACSIGIRDPLTGSSAPTPVKVVITGNASVTHLKLMAGGVDYSGFMMDKGNNTFEGLLRLPAGMTTLYASADIFCWYCGGTTPTTSQVAINVTVDNAFMDIEAGESHTCGIDASNKAWCWGDNSYGQLGTGAAADLTCTLDPSQPSRPCRMNPAPVDGVLEFQTVSAGQAHSCGLSTSNQVYCWGRNNRGQLGNGTQADSRVPVLVSGTNSYKSLSVGDAHSCAVATGGELDCWGDNARGQLGSINLNGCLVGTPSGCSPVPVRQGTNLPGGMFLFNEVSGGARHTCGSNLLWVKCWGDNTEGQMGINTIGSGTGGANANLSVSGQFVTYAMPLDATNFGAGVSAGWAHSCAFRSNGLDCWGDNHDGQLGGGWQMISFPSPKPATGGTGQLMTGISAGFTNTCALLQASQGGLIHPVCAGRNDKGQLGTPGGTSSNTFAAVALGSASTLSFFKVTTGRAHSCVLSNLRSQQGTTGRTNIVGKAYCWGDNGFGQVGQNYQQKWTSATEVHFL